MVTFDRWDGLLSCLRGLSGRVVVPVGLDGCRPGVGTTTASRPYLGDLHAIAIVTPRSQSSGE